jgi:hypothetical protein
MLYYWISEISLYISLLYLRSHFVPKIIQINTLEREIGLNVEKEEGLNSFRTRDKKAKFVGSNFEGFMEKLDHSY